MLAAEQQGDARTGFGGPSVPAWGPTDPREPAVTLGPAQAFGVGATGFPSPWHPGLGVWVQGALRASSLLPAGLAGTAFGVPLLGEAFLLFITLMMLPSCQPCASPACPACLPALPALPASSPRGSPGDPCPGRDRAGGGRHTHNRGVGALQGPSDLHSCIACLQLLNKLLHLSPPPPRPLPACQALLNPLLPRSPWEAASAPRCAPEI